MLMSIREQSKKKSKISNIIFLKIFAVTLLASRAIDWPSMLTVHPEKTLGKIWGQILQLRD